MLHIESAEVAEATELRGQIAGELVPVQVELREGGVHPKLRRDGPGQVVVVQLHVLQSRRDGHHRGAIRPHGQRPRTIDIAELRRQIAGEQVVL